jgi:hypothetical protein
LLLDPITILTQDLLSYSNAELPWVVENTSKAVFISSSGGGSGGGSGNSSSRQRPGRSMRALRQQISSLFRRCDEKEDASLSSMGHAANVNPDELLNQTVTDALSLRNLMGHVIEDAAVRAMYSIEHGKRLGACLLRCIVLTPSVYYSAFVVHVAENVLRGLASSSPPPPPSLATSLHLPGGIDTSHEQQLGHASEEVPVIEAAGENTTTSTTANLPVPQSITSTSSSGTVDVASVPIDVPESMHLVALMTFARLRMLYASS